MNWPRLEVAHRPSFEASIPGPSPRVIVAGDELRLAVPERMPLIAIVIMLVFCAVGAGLVGTIIYFAWDQFPAGNGGLIAIASVIGFFGIGGVLGGFVGGWYMTKSKGPLAVHRLGSGEIHFPQMSVTLKRDDVVALELVIGGYYWRQPNTGWGRGRLWQIFCHLRGPDQKRVIVHSTSKGSERAWRGFAREVGLPLDRHEIKRSDWPRVD